MFPFTKELRAATGKGDGDEVRIVIWKDEAPRVVEVPKDLAAALKKNPQANTNFAAFAFTHQKEYVRWVEEAKKPETRTKRIEETVKRSHSKQKFS